MGGSRNWKRNKGIKPFCVFNTEFKLFTHPVTAVGWTFGKRVSQAFAYSLGELVLAFVRG